MCVSRVDADPSKNELFKNREKTIQKNFPWFLNLYNLQLN